MDKTKSKLDRKMMIAEYQERERSMGVYQIKNIENGRLFIGSSTNLEGLWNKEKFILDMGSHQNKTLQQDWKHFGGEKFEFLILETVKFESKIRYDYRDVIDAEGREPADVVRQYKREVERLRDVCLEKLQPYEEKGYN